ncbi:hypothetical protein ASE27_09925 [Oerskovia sp. Root918]|uniref:DUF2304 domain-containing protein n=1 Tax=Oerskovia sp. Root918 TaxID=1736607 RepID=UPI0006F87414|nr:DUF2304 domain-containing protein [Oerskovia sp. Root918]KRD36771.1 hypothetical protein ASE27_09925 [Oerskovia sp. Root918]
MTNETDPGPGPDQQEPTGGTGPLARATARTPDESAPGSATASSADPAATSSGKPSEQPEEKASASATTSPAAPANPFAGIPVSDYVRDGVAALLLFVSLTMPWDFANRASDKVEVILVSVLSLLSLALPYLARTGVLPTTWTVHTTRRVRLLANAPYGLLVAVYVVLDLVNGTAGNGWGGLGTGLALGLAGAVLAAQPRQAELGPVDQDRAVSQTWVKVLIGIGALAVVGAVVAFVFSLTLGLGVVGIFARLVVAALAVGLVGLPVWGILRKQESWRLVLVGLGIALVVLYVLNTGNFLVSYESLRGGQFGLLLIPAAAAVAASPAVARSTASASPVETWVAVAVDTLDLVLVVAAVLTLQAILWLAAGLSGVVVILALVLGLLMVGVSLVARRALARDAVSGRTLALGGAGVVAVLGIVLLIVVANQSGLGIGVGTDLLLLAFGLPAITAFALTVPAEVRTHFAENRPASVVGADAAPSAYVWQPPAPRPVRPQPAQEPVAGPYGSGSYATGPDGYGPAAGAREQDPAAPVSRPTSAQPGAQAPYQPSPQPYSPAPAQQPAQQPAQPVAQEPHLPAQPAQQPTQPVAQEQYRPAQPSQQPYSPAQPQQQPVRPVEQYQPTQVLPAQGVQSARPVQPAVQERSGYAARPGYAAQAAGETAVLPAYQDPQPVGFSAAQALDPSTPLEVLAQIVQEAPHLRPQVAANPSTYPALLEWLGNLGDPAVDAALRSRGR